MMLSSKLAHDAGSLPPTWRDDNWVANMRTLSQWARCVVTMCNVTTEDHKLYAAHRAHLIRDDDARDVVLSFSAYMHDVLEYCKTGIAAHNANRLVPTDCMIHPPNVSSQQTAAWAKHVAHEVQPLTELSATFDKLRRDIDARLEAHSARNEDGEYSSYSDYSESETTDSDEEDDDDERDNNKDNNKKPVVKKN